MERVVITYCRPCGYHKRALSAADVLRNRFGVQAELVAGSGGIFQVAVDDVVVAARTKDSFPDDATIADAVARALK